MHPVYSNHRRRRSSVSTNAKSQELSQISIIQPRSKAKPDSREGDAKVEKWLKPGRNQFRIDYRSGEAYEPDFVVETQNRMLIVEVKARNELDDPTVKAKAAAATKWCRTATAFAQDGKGKPWVYALIPDDQIIGSATLDGLIAKFASA